MFIDHLSSGLFAAATTARYRQLTLHIEQGGRAMVDGLADGTISDGIADADVHERSRSELSHPISI
jgi:hypothetical protein